MFSNFSPKNRCLTNWSHCSLNFCPCKEENIPLTSREFEEVLCLSPCATPGTWVSVWVLEDGHGAIPLEGRGIDSGNKLFIHTHGSPPFSNGGVGTFLAICSWIPRLVPPLLLPLPPPFFQFQVRIFLSTVVHWYVKKLVQWAPIQTRKCGCRFVLLWPNFT